MAKASPHASLLAELNALLAQFASLPDPPKTDDQRKAEERILDDIRATVAPLVKRWRKYRVVPANAEQVFYRSFFSRLRNQRRDQPGVPLVVTAVSYLWKFLRDEFDRHPSAQLPAGEDDQPWEGRPAKTPTTLEIQARTFVVRELEDIRVSTIDQAWPDVNGIANAGHRLLYYLVAMFLPYHEVESDFCDDFDYPNSTKDKVKLFWAERLVDAFVQTQPGVVPGSKLLELYKMTHGFEVFGPLMALPHCSYLIPESSDGLPSVAQQLKSSPSLACDVLLAVWRALGTASQPFPDALNQYALRSVKIPPPEGYIFQRPLELPGFVLAKHRGTNDGN